MDKNLPKVYANPINKELNNTQEIYVSGESPRVYKQDVAQAINNIFASSNHVYKSNVIITTENGNINTTIIGIAGSNLLTLSGDKIPIKSILNIEKV